MTDIKENTNWQGENTNSQFRVRVYFPEDKVTDTISMSPVMYYCDSIEMFYKATHNLLWPVNRPFHIMLPALFNDKNWKEIYKWDLLKYKWNKLVREVDIIKWSWCIIHWKTFYKLHEYWLEYEIIWNIHENKDLIWTVL